MTFSGDDVAIRRQQRRGADRPRPAPTTKSRYARVRPLVAAIELPLVIDASALNAFAFARRRAQSRTRRPRVITPHPGELARLIGATRRKINAHRIDAAREAARVTRLRRRAQRIQTLIADPDGHVNVNPTGNPGMASGGMGDVLGGMIAALLARGIDPFDAACAAVYLHGFAGDMLKDEMGDTAWPRGIWRSEFRWRLRTDVEAKERLGVRAGWLGGVPPPIRQTPKSCQAPRRRGRAPGEPARRQRSIRAATYAFIATSAPCSNQCATSRRTRNESVASWRSHSAMARRTTP